MELLLKILVFGAVNSGIFALMAVGVTLIYGIGRVINFAHGAFYMLGCYFTYLLMFRLGWSLLAAMMVAIVLVALVAVAVDRVLINPIREREIIVWILTLALGFFLRELVVVSLGTRPVSIPPMVEGSATPLGLATISNQRIFVIIASAVAIALLWAMLFFTKVGKAMRAVSMNRDSASLMGINVNLMYALAMAVSGALAALAGIIIAPLSTLSPDMGFRPLLLAFTVVIFGGLGSVKGSLMAALIMGYVGTLTAFLIHPELILPLSLSVIFLTLIFRPSGLFGVSEE